MQVLGSGSKAWLLGSALLFTSPAFVLAAPAQQRSYAQETGRIGPSVHYTGTGLNRGVTSQARGRIPAVKTASRPARGHLNAVAQAKGISCVPYAREVSGIQVTGNAWQWWENAVGQYARGKQPEPGSVLSFRSNHRMPLGHVAVVARIVNPREILVDQANWPSNALRGPVSHDVAVVDVSEANNWSAVRVQLGHRPEFGSVYPTNGFIYNRPDTGIVTAAVSRPAPQPVINPIPSDLRPVAERPWHVYEEVAESPAAAPRRGIDLRPISAVRFGN